MTVRRYRADLLLPGDRTPYGVVADVFGDGEHVKLVLEDCQILRLPRSVEVEVRTGTS